MLRSYCLTYLITPEINSDASNLNNEALLITGSGIGSGSESSIIKSSFKKDLGSQSIIRGEKGSITINDTWFGDAIKKNIGNITYEINKKSYSKVFSYEIESISKAILNDLKESPFPGMTLEETLLNTKILEEWLNG